MAKQSYKPKPQETSVLLQRELQRRGMSGTEIEAALRKKKRRKVIEFNAVHSRNALPMPRSTSKPARAMRGEAAPDGSDRLCTVEFAARQLKVHNKTLLRFIRDGRLRATRVGKSYRILRTDLEAFSGLPAQIDAPAERASVTSIIDLPNIAADAAQRMSRNITAALSSSQQRGIALRADVIHDIDRRSLKVVVVGAPSDAVNLLSLIRIWMEQ